MKPPKPSAAKPAGAVALDALHHPDDVTRTNIPTAETSSLLAEAEARPVAMLYPRNPDLDPQLVWRGKDAQDAQPLAVATVPIYIQEKVRPEALIRDLQRQTRQGTAAQADLFGNFDRIVDPETRLEFYSHPENWSNRMILGDSLLVMNSLAEKEELRGQVQCIYFDPPYGIRFNSNWQASTRSRDVKDGKAEDVTREPEQLRAFRDTWRDGIHSYLTFLRDRLTVARELLTESGSIFVQIGDENVHRVRAVMDEVFGEENHVSTISVQKTGGATSEFLANTLDFLIWFARDVPSLKYRQLLRRKEHGVGHGSGGRYDQTDEGGRVYRLTTMTSARPPGSFPVELEGRVYRPTAGFWKTGERGFTALIRSSRVRSTGRTLNYIRYLDDFPAYAITNIWTDTGGSVDKTYVVETSPIVIERCILMATDPGDLVLDPTCGSGTTATVAEQWGRRWITIDTSRVAMALARTRVMAARYPAYLLADSKSGRAKEAELTGLPAPETPTGQDIRQGFVYERVPHVTLKSIANNAEIDVLWEEAQRTLEPLRAALNGSLSRQWEEWEVAREPGDPWPKAATETWAALRAANHGTTEAATLLTQLNRLLDRHYVRETLPDAPRDPWPAEPTRLHAAWWEARTERQRRIDASIARNADTEYLYDRPYEDRARVRVAGPFTVESLSPHRVLPPEDDPALLEALADADGTLPPRHALRTRTEAEGGDDFVRVVLDNLARAGVQNTKKHERLTFATIRPWPGGQWVSAEAEYEEAGTRRRAAIVIGPEYGTVGQDLVRAAVRECRDWADVLVIAGFAFDPMVGEDTMSFGRLAVLKARMSNELHAAEAYKAGGGNLFTVFGEPDLVLERTESGNCVVRLRGVDIFDPNTGEVRASGRVEDDVACWFIDSDYDGDSFFVRHAYFLGGKAPYEKLKAALRAEVDEDAWATLYRAESRPFPPPKSGRIAVKVINHYGDEAMRVFRVE